MTDEENYWIWDAMGVPRTDGVFQKDSEAPFSSDGMVTFAQAIREGKNGYSYKKTFAILYRDTPISVRYMFDHQEESKLGKTFSR